MSEPKAEIARDLFAKWNAHRVRETTDYFTEDVEFDARALRVADIQRIYHGTDDVRRMWAEWLPSWDHIQADPVWIETAGALVVVWVHQQLVGRTSHVPLTLDYGWVFTFRGERISHVRFVLDETAAREALRGETEASGR